MVMDRNPKFDTDAQFAEGARRVADLLWENTGGDVSAFPKSYLETLRHDYSDGRVSMMELIDRVDLPAGATYDDYVEVIDALLYADPSQWPDPESVIGVKTDKLLSQGEDFSEAFDFEEYAEEDLSHKIEQFLKKIIASVYTEGVTDITDENGDPPNEHNNFLLSDDGTEFNGIFYGKRDGKTKSHPFTILESKGNWQIRY
jgi:hypothetical protein